MASAIIHLCVAKKINERFNLNEKEFLLGAIAPDISKQIGETKVKSHFLSTSKDDVPNIREFLTKYADSMNKPFNLGYFVHLYTDKIWFDEFLSSLRDSNCIKLKDNTILRTSEEEIVRLIYNDYTNLNVSLLDFYNMDLSLFYNEFRIPDSNIDEIPIDKLYILLEKMADIIIDSKKEKEYIFDLTDVLNFIDYSADKIINKIYEYNIKIHK